MFGGENEKSLCLNDVAGQSDGPVFSKEAFGISNKETRVIDDDEEKKEEEEDDDDDDDDEEEEEESGEGVLRTCS